MSKIRVAVVGAGQFGRNHVRVARESSRSELVAVVDTDPTRAHEAAAGCLALAGYPHPPHTAHPHRGAAARQCSRVSIAENNPPHPPPPTPPAASSTRPPPVGES